MSTQTTTPEYMLLFRGTLWDKRLSPEEIQKVMSRWYDWMDQLTQQGKLKSGQPLDRHEGKIISWKKGHMVADGPFPESKEAIGGYFLLRADDFEEAVEIARQCPAIEYGLNVEVRPIATQCPPFQHMKEPVAETTA